jgi:DNA-binding NarL/FixJ family response regulator
MIKLIIADDHQMFIDGIKSLLSSEPDILIAGEALTGNQVLQHLEKNTVDIILMDINMPELDGMSCTRIITDRYPSVKVIMLSMHNTEDYITGVLEAGAKGYIIKNTGKTELIKAIHEVNSGKTYYSDEVTNTIMLSLTQKKTPAPAPLPAVALSKRETEVIKLIVHELTTQEIADKLFISQHTVETHRKNLLSKLNVRNTAGLVKYAYQHGILD